MKAGVMRGSPKPQTRTQEKKTKLNTKRVADEMGQMWPQKKQRRWRAKRMMMGQNAREWRRSVLVARSAENRNIGNMRW